MDCTLNLMEAQCTGSWGSPLPRGLSRLSLGCHAMNNPGLSYVQTSPVQPNAARWTQCSLNQRKFSAWMMRTSKQFNCYCQFALYYSKYSAHHCTDSEICWFSIVLNIVNDIAQYCTNLLYFYWIQYCSWYFTILLYLLHNIMFNVVHNIFYQYDV